MPGRRKGRARKMIYDPVHGPIVLEGAPLELIGHRAFQRLWGIRQTGLAHLVFPGANHTRLEHSLGVYSVAARMAQAVGLGAEEAEEVAVGGLLHDLGHAPFSHTLDGPLVEVLGYGHERISRSWISGAGPDPAGERPHPGPTIPEILERWGLRPGRVADLVDPRSRTDPRPLCRAMLHGPIDADRLDYLQRDAHYTGVAHGTIDAERLLATLGAGRGRLVFAEKGRSAVEGFLLGRTLMYTTVYYHKTVRGAEVMMASAVERYPGYPDGARTLFGGTDGELLFRLREAGGYPARVAQAIAERRLFKRVTGIRNPTVARRRRLHRLLTRPAERREAERELAGLVGAPEGSVLLDLAGLEPRPGGGGDLAEIAIQEEGRLTTPFARSAHWRSLLLRPPTPWALAVYVHPDWRHAASERLPRALSQYL